MNFTGDIVPDDSLSLISDVTDFDGLGEGNVLFLQAPICGRETELEILQSVLQSVLGRTLQWVRLYGPSGAGKTALFISLRASACPDIYFASGKFDEYSRKEPFTAISTAFEQVIDCVIQDELNRDKIKDALRAAFTVDELALMCSLVSNLLYVLGPNENEQEHDYSLRKFQAFDGFKLLCQTFLRTLAQFQRICMFLDDLQWADQESLSILTSIVTDEQSTNILVITANRNDEQEPSEAWTALQQETTTLSLATDLEIKNLTDDAVTELLSSQLNTPSESIRELGTLIGSRTFGNPFHVIQFIQSLRVKQLIQQDSDTKVWSWNLDAVREQTSVSDNVADLILGVINRLHPFVQGMLKLASALGYQFDVDLVKMVALGQLPPDKRASMEAMYNGRIDQAFAVAVKAGMVETRGTSGTQFQFVHDKIRHELYSLFADDERPSLHLRIGQILQAYSASLPDRDDALVFLVVEQLDRGLVLVQDFDQRVSIAELNLEVSNMAMCKSAFEAATEYIDMACALLADGGWERSYELTLQVFTASANINAAVGQFEESNQAATAVLENAQETLDKMPVYYIMIDSLSSQEQFDEALEIGMKVMNKELGIKTPRHAKPHHSVAEFAAVTRLVGKKTDEELMGLATLDDAKMAAVIRLTVALSFCAFFAQENKNYPFLWLRAMKLTMRHGQDQLTAPIFACYGLVNAVMYRYTAAHRFGMLARQQSQKRDGWDQVAVTEVLICCFTSHWKLPMVDTLPYYEKAYQMALAGGNTNFAVMADISRIETIFITGGDLDTVETEGAHCCNLMAALGKKTLMKACLPVWQCVLNLQGKSDDPLRLTGLAMDEDEIVGEQCQTGYDLALTNAHQLKMLLASLFQDWEACADAAKVMNATPEIFLGIAAHFFALSFTFFSGVAYFNLAKNSLRRRYLGAARRKLHRLSNLVDNGTPDAVPVHAVLLAEKVCYQKKSAIIIKRHFDEAIQKCQTSKQRHYEAFANERCGTVLSEMDQQDVASPYLQRAIDLYREWGALAKVEQLEEAFFSSASPMTEIYLETDLSLGKQSKAGSSGVDTKAGSSLASSTNNPPSKAGSSGVDTKAGPSLASSTNNPPSVPTASNSFSSGLSVSIDGSSLQPGSLLEVQPATVS